MKLKLLLFLTFIAGMVNAQNIGCDYPDGVDTTLIISEASFLGTSNAYVEITNIGSEAVNLKEFKLGRLEPWSRASSITDLCTSRWSVSTSPYIFLPDRVLGPGESFVISTAYDYGPKHYEMGLGRLGGNERPKQIGMYEVADKLIHMQEPIFDIVYPEDSVSTALTDPEQLIRRGDYQLIFASLDAGETFYLEHHYITGDSAVVDQVGGVFDSQLLTGRNQNIAYDIAGVQGGVQTSILVRKKIVKEGNLDFANARGISLEDSEWIPIEFPTGSPNAWRDLWWTVGNHGNYVLDATTLESLTADIIVDFAGKTITVPWGTLRLDEIMRNMKRKPGVAWNYHLNAVKEDSLYRSARNGDKLVVYVVGDGLTKDTFNIIVNEPTADANSVVPIDHQDYLIGVGPISARTQNGILSWPRVTKNVSGIDTITGSGYGLPFDLRKDTLQKYLEKPANASWEFVPADGIQRPELKNGDRLKVTSESGKVKEYYLQVQTYYPSINANLAAITWPDIPAMYRDAYGWKGDTIPNFSSGTTTYRVQVPFDVEGIPALVAKPQHVNARVKTTRAKSLKGTLEERTITFEVFAENDTISKIYYIELVQEKFSDKIEPYIADPFYSEFVNTYQGNAYLEVYNPGTEPLDLRDYMFSMRGSQNTSDLYVPITSNVSWLQRFTNYIPGLKYVDQASWAVTPRMLVPDVNTNPIVQGGETFVMAVILRGEATYPGIKFPSYNVQFADEVVPGVPNNWGDTITTASTAGVPIPPNGNRKNSMFMYKILNDSVKLGLKANTDPNDFEIIDVWGMELMTYWVVGGYKLANNGSNDIYIRKPNVTKGNPVLQGSFGTNQDDSEWTRVVPNTAFSTIPVPERYLAALGSLNSHTMTMPTFYRSTVTALLYQVSDGYGPAEQILGVKTGTTVADFLSKISKEDEGQTLTVKSADNTELATDALLSMNDKLVVLSADGKNSTTYRLDVTAEGLSSNAVLTSTKWDITIVDGTGAVSGFDNGTSLQTLIDDVTVPAGAVLTVIDQNGSYVPFTIVNFDTAMVNVKVNTNIYLDVLAEDGLTRIVYQLKPTTSENDAFLFSDVYTVTQNLNLIELVPRGTSYATILANVTSSLGASLKVIDKMGFERILGNINEDDKVVVTSSNGLVTNVYYISFLPTLTIPSSTYLAYVVSDSYVVDQLNSIITGGSSSFSAATTIAEFFSRITLSAGATAMVTDADGVENTTGVLKLGNVLKVTSADQKISVIYQLVLDVTSVGKTGMEKIEVYPNPATDLLNISGIQAGNHIRVFNFAGVLIQERIANGNFEVLSLNKLSSGMFFIVISNDNKILGRFKAIKN